MNKYMQISDVVFGDWLVEGPGANADNVSGPAATLGALAMAAARSHVGRLSIGEQTYRFTAADDVRRAGSPARASASFTKWSKGRVLIAYPAGATAATPVQQLPRPPLHGGYAQVLQLAAIDFIDADAGIGRYRIVLDIDLGMARFAPDFHANLQNNPYQITRRMR